MIRRGTCKACPAQYGSHQVERKSTAQAAGAFLEQGHTSNTTVPVALQSAETVTPGSRETSRQGWVRSRLVVRWCKGYEVGKRSAESLHTRPAAGGCRQLQRQSDGRGPCLVHSFQQRTKVCLRWPGTCIARGAWINDHDQGRRSSGSTPGQLVVVPPQLHRGSQSRIARHQEQGTNDHTKPGCGQPRTPLRGAVQRW